MIDQKQIEEWRKLCEDATEGPWEWVAEDESMISLGTKDKFLESMVLAACRCKSCIKWLEQDPKQDAGAWQRHRCFMPGKSDEDFIAAARTALPQLLDEVDRLNAIFNTKIEGYTLRYSVSATGTFDGASAEGKTLEEAVRALGEKLDKLNSERKVQ
jgi:hypothetical protein